MAAPEPNETTRKQQAPSDAVAKERLRSAERADPVQIGVLVLCLLILLATCVHYLL